MRTCIACGKEMTREVINHRYRESGLDYVVLLGVEMRRCPFCGEEELVIPRMEELHRVIARAVASREGALTGSEIRFLRKYLGLSGVTFAKRIGVSHETVSRWENDKQEMSPPLERFLRLMVFNEKPATHYPLERLEVLTKDRQKGKAALRIEEKEGAWSPGDWEPFGVAV